MTHQNECEMISTILFLVFEGIDEFTNSDPTFKKLSSNSSIQKVIIEDEDVMVLVVHIQILVVCVHVVVVAVVVVQVVVRVIVRVVVQLLVVPFVEVVVWPALFLRTLVRTAGFEVDVCRTSRSRHLVCTNIIGLVDH
jgi:hypothetical protein